MKWVSEASTTANFADQLVSTQGECPRVLGGKWSGRLFTVPPTVLPCRRLDFLRAFVHCGSITAMHTPAHFWSSASLALAALSCSLGIQPDAAPLPTGRLASLPRYTLWAWERREDLHSLNPHRFAVAYLDQTVTIGLTVVSQPRRDPVALPARAARIPVVRIEALRSAVLNATNRADVLEAILASADEPGIVALQLDFDATRSQHPFYRDLLFDLRRQMPPNLPLSITALASWCSYDDWLAGLPIDEAVPMLFRMEPDRRRTAPNLDDFRIREPLCQSSTGVSTTEP
jgi:hypothetical protein